VEGAIEIGGAVDQYERFHRGIVRSRHALGVARRRMLSASREVSMNVVSSASGYQLFIANRNYSSWSLRPWVLMRALGIPFEESFVRFVEGPAGSSREAFLS